MQLLTRNSSVLRRPSFSLIRELSDSSKLEYIADSDEDIRLNESDCEESEERADVIDNIPVNPDKHVAKDDTE
ncbi:hypothetical protein TNCV_2601121 [Trichonephila clavipes]|nr:hypothetical protein TNCV_2601121 [Trichonephila clavipes]